MGIDFEEILATFHADAEEHLEAMDEAVSCLQVNVLDEAAIAALFRAVHTLKGDSGVVGLDLLCTSLHAFESELDLMRNGMYNMSDEVIDPLRHVVDEVAHLVECAREGNPLPTNFADTVSELSVFKTEGAEIEMEEAPDEGYAFFDGMDELDDISELDDLDNIEIETNEQNDPQLIGQETEPPLGTDAALDTVKETAKPVVTDTEERPSQANSKAEKTATTNAKESIKVDRDRLDQLINVIGELVIGQSMVQEDLLTWQAETGRESIAMSQLTKTVRDLQELSLSLRMVPISGVFKKMGRTVRELGRKLGKEIHFVTEGEETELDKTVVDKIGDPLLHMVRNAADHGIEMPDDRVATGKPAHGQVTLRAYHQGGNIYIEISDDGKGLDRDALFQKGVDRGIIKSTDSLTDQEILNLIFAPGFSTAAQVTDVSGRGVGMDVVRRNVEALQGSVALTSEKGKGSTVTIRLPLTLAIMDGLSFKVDQEVYTIPILSVSETLCPEPDDIKRVAGLREVVMVREEVVPLIRLDELLVTNKQAETKANDSHIVIVEERKKKYALLVDDLLGQSQVVIKNLESNYRKVDGIAGATILGDGRIAMIVDVYGLVELAEKSFANKQENLRIDEPDFAEPSTHATGVTTP